MTLTPKPSPGVAPIQTRVLHVVSGTIQTTAEIAREAGVTHAQAKNALAYLAEKGRVVRIRGTWACSWALPGTVAIPEPDPDEHWTPRPWVHPYSAKARAGRAA